MESDPKCREVHTRAALPAEVRQRLTAMRPVTSIASKQSYRLCVHCGIVEPANDMNQRSFGSRSDWLLLRQNRGGGVELYLGIMLGATISLAAHCRARDDMPDFWEAAAATTLFLAAWVAAFFLEFRLRFRPFHEAFVGA